MDEINTEQLNVEEYFTSYEDLEVNSNSFFYFIFSYVNFLESTINISHIQVHRLMLKDRPRQKAYQEAILSNRKLFAGKTVLDVGAGTGILSIFCAQAGASKVYAVEASNMAKLAEKIVIENGFEQTIEVHQTKIEDFNITGEDQHQIDIIVSEWMGFYLLHEGMLDSVLIARDKFLKPNGSMFPQNASITVAPCQLPSLFDAWNIHDGVQMRSFGAALRAQKFRKPDISIIPSEDLLHEGTVIAWIDLNDVTLDDLDEFIFDEIIVVNKIGRYQGICMWFDVEFPMNNNGDTVILSTAPNAEPTHWMQSIILLPDHVQEDVEVGDPIAFRLVMKRNQDNKRQYKIEIEVLDSNEVEHPVPCDCNMTKCILVKEHIKSIDVEVPNLI